MANSTSYSVVNSLSPMMFRKKKASDGGTRNERLRSRSMECVLDKEQQKELRETASGKGKKSPAEIVAAQLRAEQPQWKELPLVKSTSPVVVCILPALSMDFVCSALLAVGATPLITEDPQDMEKDLKNSKAVVVDVGAPVILLEEFMALWDVGKCPLVLVTSQAGSNDRKKELAQRIIDDSGPSVITGRLGDIYAVAQDVLEKANGSSLGTSSDSDHDETDTAPQRYRRKLPAKSVDFTGEEAVGPRYRQQSLPAVVLDNGEEHSKGKHLPRAVRRALAGRKSPSASPRTSPSSSPRSSPRASPRLIKKKNQGPLHRVPTALPMVHMKGQFRDATIGECPVSQALENGQLLAAHTDSLVHLYETNVVTNGEMVVEISNNQLGMGNLHSVHPCAGAIMAAVLACVEEQGEDITVKECSHALGLYYVAAEEAACNATGQRGVVSPGSLRQHFLDALHFLDEREVREKAQIYAHSAGTSKS